MLPMSPDSVLTARVKLALRRAILHRLEPTASQLSMAN